MQRFSSQTSERCRKRHRRVRVLTYKTLRCFGLISEHDAPSQCIGTREERDRVPSSLLVRQVGDGLHDGLHLSSVDVRCELQAENERWIGSIGIREDTQEWDERGEIVGRRWMAWNIRTGRIQFDR